MKTEFNSLPIDSRAQHRPVIGIPEWMCYYANYDQPCPGPEAIEECVDLHQQWGIDHLVWNCGRVRWSITGLICLTSLCSALTAIWWADGIGHL